VKRVLYIHHTPTFVGSARSLSYLLQELDRTRYEPVVLLTREGPVREAFEALGIPVHHVPLRHIWEAPSPAWYNVRNRALNWLAFLPSRPLAAFLREQAPDVVHLNDTALLSAGITALRCGLPVVCHVRSVHRTAGLPQLRARLLVSRIEEVSAALVAIAEEYALQFGGSPKVRVVYNSVDFAAIDEARGTGKRIRDELGIGPDVALIGMVGTLTRHKGAWDFIRACGLALKQARGVPMKFAIAGRIPEGRPHHRLRDVLRIVGPRRPLAFAERLARECGVRDELLLLGHRTDVYSVMDALDVVVFPTRLDATGRPVLEGSALGKPSIAAVPTRQSGVLVHGETGLIVPPERPAELADAILALASDRELARRMGRKACQLAASSFDPRRNIEPIHRLYDDITG